MKNTITKHPYDKRNLPTTDELLSEMRRAFPQTAGLHYRVR